jgi:succinyl-CoA synthetase alpha subunit
MGHAGALVHGRHGSYEAKKAALENAGVKVFAALDEMVAGIAEWHSGLHPAHHHPVTCGATPPR